MGRPALREELLEVFRWLSERKVGRRGWRYCRSGAWSKSSSSVPDRPGWPWATTCAARACGLRRYVLFDANPTPGGAWSHMWPSLRLFSPPEYSSLPGWLMPPAVGDALPAGLACGGLPDPVRASLRPAGSAWPCAPLRCAGSTPTPRAGCWSSTTAGRWAARAVVSATGTWGRPVRPALPRDDLRRSPAAQRSATPDRTSSPVSASSSSAAATPAPSSLAEVSQVARDHLGDPTTADVPARRRRRAGPLHGGHRTAPGAGRRASRPRWGGQPRRRRHGAAGSGSP